MYIPPHYEKLGTREDMPTFPIFLPPPIYAPVAVKMSVPQQLISDIFLFEFQVFLVLIIIFVQAFDEFCKLLRRIKIVGKNNGVIVGHPVTDRRGAPVDWDRSDVKGSDQLLCEVVLTDSIFKGQVEFVSGNQDTMKKWRC